MTALEKYKAHINAKMTSYASASSLKPVVVMVRPIHLDLDGGSNILLSRPIPGHNEYKLETIQTHNLIHSDVISQGVRTTVVAATHYEIRMRGPSSENRHITNIADGKLTYGGLPSPWREKYDPEVALRESCFVWLSGTPDSAELASDKFWRTYIDDAIAIVAVAEVLGAG